MVAVIEPSSSSVLSSTVGTLWMVSPDVPTVTVWEPSFSSATKSSSEPSAISKFTVISALGAGVAVTVKVAAVPSDTEVPAAMLISGLLMRSSLSVIVMVNDDG